MYLARFRREDIRYIDMVKDWWSKRAAVDNVFSDYGFMIMGEQGGLVAGFLYPIVGCSVAMFGFPIANPEISEETRREALSMLTTFIEMEAKKLNYEFLISYAGSQGAIEMFKREGYAELDQCVVNFGKRL
jgi:hypothetical protein